MINHMEQNCKGFYLLFIITILTVMVAVWSWTYNGAQPVYGFCIAKAYGSGSYYASNDFRLEMLLTSGETEYWTVPEDIYDEASVGCIVKRWNP